MRAHVILFLGLLLIGVVSAEEGEPPKDFEDVQRWVERFENPDRESWQRTAWVLRMLGLRRGSVVADLGAGTGYLTGRLSRIVGPEGKVYAVDIEPAMLEYIRNRSDTFLGNVTTILAKPNDPMLPAGEVDAILCLNTWHHIEDRVKYLKRLRPVLKPGGRFVLIDFHEGELPVGPPAGHKLERESAIAEFEKAGWQRVSESVQLPYQYFIVFQPPAGRSRKAGR